MWEDLVLGFGKEADRQRIGSAAKRANKPVGGMAGFMYNALPKLMSRLGKKGGTKILTSFIPGLSQYSLVAELLSSMLLHRGTSEVSERMLGIKPKKIDERSKFKSIQDEVDEFNRDVESAQKQFDYSQWTKAVSDPLKMTGLEYGENYLKDLLGQIGEIDMPSFEIDMPSLFGNKAKDTPEYLGPYNY